MHSLENIIYTNLFKNILLYLSKWELKGDLCNVCIEGNSCSQNPVFLQKMYSDIKCFKDDAEKIHVRMKVKPPKKWKK